VRIVKRIVVPITSKEMIVKVIEFISDALTADAKERYGKAYRFKTDTRFVGENAIESYVQFFPYKYDFIWKINRDSLGYEVVLDARTPGKWRDSLFGMDEKLNGLVDTQWSALVNFFHGYLTALAYRSSKSSPKGHIRKTRRKLKER
jgi:hypothetical protein